MRAVLILIFLTLLNILNFADRYIMASFAVDMIADLRLTNLQFTLLTGFVFTVFYTAMGLIMGALADRYHRPRLMAIGLLVWSALTAATGAAKNFLQVALARVFIGVGEATLSPAALGVLGDVFSPKYRAFASGFYYLGVPMGIGGAFIIAGTLGAEIGWRKCFYVLGLLGVVFTGLLLMMRDPRPEAHQAMTAAGSHRPFTQAFPELKHLLLSSPALTLAMLGGVFVVFAQGALVLDQVWLVEERGFATAQAQKLTGAMFLVGGILGSILGGIGGDLYQARRKGGRLYFLAWVYVIAAPISLLYRFADPAGTAFYVYMFVGCITLTLAFGPLFAAVQDLAPERLRSTTIAFLILCLALLGSAPGNLLAGWLADLFKAAAMPEPITLAVLIGVTPGLFAIPCFYISGRLMERPRTKNQ
ncbi:MAG: MFS transporter [Nevskiales bacterium]